MEVWIKESNEMEQPCPNAERIALYIWYTRNWFNKYLCKDLNLD